jgi:hypothetical protein
MMKLSSLIFAASLGLGLASVALAAAGDTYVYRISNGYNNELRGKVSYRVAKVDADRVEVAVTTDTPSAGLARTEVYTKDGNWLRRVLVNHDQLREYDFAPALPVYADSGSWSVRVDAVDPASGKRNSVRVDGEVIGRERITVPAGTFDTIKIRRRVYAGDWDGFMRETQIDELDWYAPQLGRPVRSETKSSWQDISRCSRGVCPYFRGDWNVLELAETSAARP